jgi:hypothetical protein
VGFILLLLLPPLWVELRPNYGLPPAPTLPVADSSRRYRVFVADWGYHTSIILEQAAGWRLGPPGHETSPFVEYAWGDRRYYMESDHRPHALFAALLLPTASVTYVDAWPGAPQQGMRTLVVRDVSARELMRLGEELERWRVGEPYPTAKGYPGRFYPAPGAYLWWSDCNRWTVDRLGGAGMARSGRGVLFSGQVSGRLQGFRSARE